MRTELDLANAALAYLVRDRLRDLDGSDLATVQMLGNLNTAKEEVIEAYDWFECRVVAALQTPSDIDTRGWDYVYTAPGDLIKLWRVGPSRGTKSYPFELGMSDDILSDTLYIYSDYGSAYARYSSSRVSIGRFSATTFDLMALKLACLTCMPILKEVKMLQFLQNTYSQKLSKAIVNATMSEPETIDVDFTPETIAVRSE